MKEPIPRIDSHPELHARLLPLCRLSPGEIWEDPVAGHRVGVLDAANPDHVSKISASHRSGLLIQDPPYNLPVGGKATQQIFCRKMEAYLSFSQQWIRNALSVMAPDAYLYIWLGADQRNGFHPLPDLMLMMRQFNELTSRSFITLRNQRGYGTSHNWMAVRQELLSYVRGQPVFDVVYTDIPKKMRGYYKTVDGRKTENLERSRSPNLRPGNVWTDIQQVFYRMHENVPGTYAQKPLKSIERIIETSSRPKDLVMDFFSHSGTTLIAAERLDRRCFTFDNDPVFAELTIRRLTHFRQTGRTGWQCENPFPEVE